MKFLCNGVFEGGGVRGIGHVGAAYALEKSGYRFLYLAGTSAGAIVASLLAAGYSGAEIREVMNTIDYLKFKQKDLLDYLGTAGKILSVILEFGIYNADYFEMWLQNLLEKKHKTTFGDLKMAHPLLPDHPYKLQVIATDLTDSRMLILPNDLADFGIDPDSYSVAKAVRMSMSIPIFYEPFRLIDRNGMVHFIVDGGMLSNYPVWILDDGKSYPEYPTFGFKFVDSSDGAAPASHAAPKVNIIDYVKMIISTTFDTLDKEYISETKGDLQRSILIPTTVDCGGEKRQISTTDFDITPEQSAALFDNGVKAGNDFLSTWNFARWRLMYRGSAQTRITG